MTPNLGSAATHIAASATFSNGSSWSAQFGFQVHKETQWNLFHKANGWLSCLNNQWYQLANGDMVCLVSAIAKHADRMKNCKLAGGFLAEIKNRDDAQALLYLIFKLNKEGKKSTSMFSIGARAVGGRWVWENSGEEVDVGLGGLLKPATSSVDLYPHDNTYLYLSLHNPPSSSKDEFMENIPYFDLYVQPGGDSEEEYLCMMKGIFIFSSVFFLALI